MRSSQCVHIPRSFHRPASYGWSRKREGVRAWNELLIRPSGRVGRAFQRQPSACRSGSQRSTFQERCVVLQGEGGCEESSVTRTYRMIEGHGIDHHEVFQVVLVRNIIPVPRHDVKRRMILKTKILLNRSPCISAVRSFKSKHITSPVQRRKGRPGIFR